MVVVSLTVRKSSPGSLLNADKTCDHRPLFVLFHHAGGASSVFYSWVERLEAHGEVVALDLPGRRRRLHDPVIRDITSAIVDVTETLRAALGTRPGRPFMMLGHSMGALLAYEAALDLRSKGFREPEALFVSGSRVPSEYGESTRLLGIGGDADIAAEALGGSSELMALGARLPSPERIALLQADLEICRSRRQRGEAPLSCPVIALTGRGDSVATSEQVKRWARYTTGPFSRREYSGSHFFLFDDAVASEVVDELICWADQIY